jgi:predicted enzyme related to lactoylglutathione lyase
MAQLFKKDISIVIYTAKLRYFYEYELLTSDFIDTEKFYERCFQATVDNYKNILAYYMTTFLKR